VRRQAGGLAGAPPATLQPGGGARRHRAARPTTPPHPAALRSRRARRGRWSRQTPPHLAATRPTSSGPRSTADHADWRPRTSDTAGVNGGQRPAVGGSCKAAREHHRALRRPHASASSAGGLAQGRPEGVERWAGGRHHPRADGRRTNGAGFNLLAGRRRSRPNRDSHAPAARGHTTTAATAVAGAPRQGKLHHRQVRAASITSR